jgi:hypothetical protein
VTKVEFDLDLSAYGIPKDTFGKTKLKTVLPDLYKQFAADLAENMKHHG